VGDTGLRRHGRERGGVLEADGVRPDAAVGQAGQDDPITVDRVRRGDVLDHVEHIPLPHPPPPDLPEAVRGDDDGVGVPQRPVPGPEVGAVVGGRELVAEHHRQPDVVVGRAAVQRDHEGDGGGRVIGLRHVDRVELRPRREGRLVCPPEQAAPPGDRVRALARRGDQLLHLVRDPLNIRDVGVQDPLGVGQVAAHGPKALPAHAGQLPAQGPNLQRLQGLPEGAQPARPPREDEPRAEHRGGERHRRQDRSCRSPAHHRRYMPMPVSDRETDNQRSWYRDSYRDLAGAEDGGNVPR